MGTYMDNDWADPNAPIELFNPSKLDCAQWAHVAKSAKMRYGCLTTKHHNGFCLWNTKTTEYNAMNAPLGRDVVREYVDAFRKEGLKVLLYYSILDMHHQLRPSLITREDIEMVKTEDGRDVYKVVGDKLTEMGSKVSGDCGYSSIGGVIGCTHVEEGIEIRKRFKNMFFLIPGYGAQGGKAEDVALYLNDGNGGVVNSSRAILLAYKKQEGREKEFALCAREEAIRMRDEIRAAVENL